MMPVTMSPLPSGVLLVFQLPLHLADPLHHDLFGCLRGDAAKAIRRDVERLPHRLPVLIQLLSEHLDVGGLGIDGNPGVFLAVGHPLVGRLKGVGQRGQQSIYGDAFVGGQRLEGF